jgi:glycosyltransferase involved in cell wall biosynthesis
MRICHVSPHLPPDQAANALLPAQLGRWMRERGDEVSFVAHDPAQTAPNAAGGLPADAVVRWIGRRQEEGRAGKLLRLGAWRLVRQVHRALNQVARRADLLHLHSNGLIVEAAASWARRRRVPYVLTLYGTEIWHYRERWPIDPFTRAYEQAAHVTFYSRRLLDRAANLGLNREDLSVVYPPVPETFQPRGDADRQAWRRSLGVTERHLVLNVKRLHPLAGQRFLLDAFAKLRAVRQDVRLVMCGEGPLRQDLTDQIAALGLTSSVTMTGLVPNDTVAGYMAAADVFVLPSLLEALPTVAVEALASGTPVISADHPGGLELQGLFGQDVTVVPRETVEPLARVLGEFLARPRRTMASTASQLAAHFRPPAVMRDFDAVYTHALRARR